MKFTSSLAVELKQRVGDDGVICDAARVSTLGDKVEDTIKNIDSDARLIRYLMRDKHGSPFEHGSMTFIVHAPIFAFWDHVRHRIGVSYNVESSRYRELQPVFFVAEHSRTQSGRPGHYVMSPGSEDQDQVMVDANESACEQAWESYQNMLAAGIAREQAMQVLPMNTMISAYVTMNPRSLMKFLELRLGPAREEMQRIASAYAAIFRSLWPVTHAAFEEHGRICP